MFIGAENKVASPEHIMRSLSVHRLATSVHRSVLSADSSPALQSRLGPTLSGEWTRFAPLLQCADFFSTTGLACPTRSLTVIGMVL